MPVKFWATDGEWSPDGVWIYYTRLEGRKNMSVAHASGRQRDGAGGQRVEAVAAE